MTKKIGVLIVLFFAFGLVWAQTSEEQKSTINWEEVQVVYDLSEVADMTKGSKMTTCFFHLSVHEVLVI